MLINSFGNYRFVRVHSRCEAAYEPRDGTNEISEKDVRSPILRYNSATCKSNAIAKRRGIYIRSGNADHSPKQSYST